MEWKRRAVFFIVFFIALIIGIGSTAIEELWVKKTIMIFLTLVVFAFSDTARQIYNHVREDLSK
ncbi:hypothetical protein [Bacillus sp. FJAT-27445]|uniref:hypothetical protein n=1 Tax=Bacillus sp. FJAT-27445 TaxID=1679166 RepID=UPI00074358B2|nr:hypothetical protein [Bacillus sp. FJAT-27445]